MSKEVGRQFRQCLIRDSEAFPMQSFGNAGVRTFGSRRLSALEKRLQEYPHNRIVTQGFLVELISKSIRQVEAESVLYKTFAERVGKIKDRTLQALPAGTAKALQYLAKRAASAPLPITEAFVVAHALAVDGELRRWLSNEPVKEPETPATTYRKLIMKHHPDRGGSGEVVAAIAELWKSVRQEQR